MNRMVLLISALALALAAGQVSAKKDGGPPGRNNKQGASVSVATVCEWSLADPTNLLVEMRLEDKSSGTTTAEVTQWSITALAKTKPGNWNHQEPLPPEASSGGPMLADLPDVLPEPPPAKLSLCATNLNGDYLIDGAKGLNVDARVTYGPPFVDDTALHLEGVHTIINRCSDDPATEDVVEPSGIKLTSFDVDTIINACEVR